ncbi:serine hydrolase [Carboxylicivirga caseinilyticus]|uniref:serine hydrolase n=1 Tax=Carboxylicivirga caseinilyticus TaxID=3417572 RepID=UPI003D358334|nr:serine hydrolase [Marinilabiliaceae bacterium A049]
MRSRKFIVIAVFIYLLTCIGINTESSAYEREEGEILPYNLPLPIQPFGLPIVISDSLFKPLRNQIDEEFQEQLQDIVSANKKWNRLISAQQLSIGVVDLSSPLNPRFARINGNHMMYAASLPKIAVLLAMEDALENGEIEENDSIRRDMRLMMSKSNNQSTTRLIDLIGFNKIANVLQDPKYNLYDEERGGGIWVGKRYAKTGQRIPDPLEGISHGATATQVCRFYYMLAYGKLVNFERSKEMLWYMSDPELHHKFVNTLDRIAPKAKLFRKSGSWKEYHSDSVLVWGPQWRRYIVVALVHDAEGENILRELIAEIDNMMMPK